MIARKLKILIVYKCLGYPLRKTVKEHLYSFKNYANADCYYIKLDIGRYGYKSDKAIPSYLNKIDFDIIFFHYGFISSRWGGDSTYLPAFKQVESLKLSKAIKVVMPQDEYKNTIQLNHFVNEFGIDVVLSVSPETEWKKIYDKVDFNKVRFYQTLTGFLDDEGVALLKKLNKKTIKDIDIGYRARNLPQWLGRHGYLKTQIAEVFQKASSKYNLKTDISIKPEDTLLGNRWPKFLARCKYMIGVEGGATVLDKDGSIWNNGLKYVKENPNASFEEIEAACFPGLDGQLQLIAISPRHLECCASKTCQILVEGSYNGILKPNIHYIELKSDFSNIDNVLSMVKSDNMRDQITEQAYKDIVESGKYSYKGFVEYAIEKSLEGQTNTDYFNRMVYYSKVSLWYNSFSDKLRWVNTFYFHKMDLLNYYYRYRWFVLKPIISFIKFIGLKKPVKKLFNIK